MDYESRAQRHHEFWQRKNKEHLIGYCSGDYFISKRFSAAEPLLAAKREIHPEDIQVSSFLPDYERMYDTMLSYGGDLFYTPEPMPGLPWLEAMSGFPIHSGKESFYALEPEQLDAGKIIRPAWMDKFLAFRDMLTEAGLGRFLCGQPILRGPADLLGTGIGQQNLIYEMVDDPESVKQKLNAFADLLLHVLKQSNTGTMYGGHAMGFYHLWCPDDCLWFQDDLSALMSPNLYKEFLYDIHTRLAKAAPYTMMHLHMASSYVVEYLLEIDELNAIQINKDIGESLQSMLPLLQRIRERKNLVLWGDFSLADIKLLQDKLKAQGVYIIVYGAGRAI